MTIREIPRIVVAGTHSGCGKTTVAAGLMAALVKKGLTVQPFKVGPDFIDPTHHTAICGRASRNLDPFMMGEEGLLRTFHSACNGADIAVIEGVMGLFDGMDGGECASTAHVARILSAPVLLVVNARGMSRSANAVIAGFRSYDPALQYGGVIFNQIGSLRHRAMIESAATAPALGWIPRRDDLAIKSRHLGLAMAHETPRNPHLAGVIAESCDLDAIVGVAGSAPPLPVPCGDVPEEPVAVRIGIAWDAAFCFYYQDNLDRLRRLGADLAFFSPLADRLPAIDGLYFGGGYPELFAANLSASPCRHDIARAADAGMPVYGECGGLMYLTESIACEQTFPLCGVLPATTEITGRVQALGYVDGTVVSGTAVLGAGSVIRGHEFHYSRVIPHRDARYAVRLSRGRGIEDGNDGLWQGSVTGTYLHAYFSDPQARHFLQSCRNTRTP